MCMYCAYIVDVMVYYSTSLIIVIYVIHIYIYIHTVYHIT